MVHLSLGLTLPNHLNHSNEASTCSEMNETVWHIHNGG